MINPATRKHRRSQPARLQAFAPGPRSDPFTRLGMSALAVLLTVVLSGAVGAPNESPVADAAEDGDVESVRALLREGADANAAQSDGMTALHWAAMHNNVTIARALIYAGATVQSKTRLGGYTPLHLASKGESRDVAAVLITNHADVNAFTTTGVTPLHFAADANAIGVIDLLLAAGADVDAPDAFSQRTPLMFAAMRGADAAARSLLAGGADPRLVTATKDYESISEQLRSEQQKRARVRAAEEEPAQDESEEAPQSAAIPETPPVTQDSASSPPEEPQVKALTTAQQIGKQGGLAALHFAAREGHRSMARILLEGGADINQVTRGDQSTPILVAVINGNYDLARDLLEGGADPNVVSDDGAGPLFATLNIEWSLRTWYPQPQAFRQQQTDYLQLMRLLLEAGADPNQRTSTHIWYAAYNAGRMGVDFTGATPFWRAAYAVDVDAMRLLVEHGADPNIWTLKLPDRRRFGDPNPANVRPGEEPMDPSGLPPVPVGGPAVHPLHAAAGVGFGTSRVAQQHRSVPDGWLPAIRYLVDELKVDPNLRDKDGYSALHHAAARGDNDVILFLVSRGADVHAISRRGQTTADLANSPEQRAQPIPATVALLEKLGSANNHECRSCGEGR